MGFKVRKQDMSVNSVEQNPFENQISVDELLLWVSRPDKTVYMRKQWRHFRVGVAIGSIVAIASVLGKIYPSNPFQEASCIFMLIILPIIFVMGVYLVLDSYSYAPWYALTNARLFVANLEEGGFVVHTMDISNIKSISVGKTCSDVGTVRCVCYSTSPTSTSRTLILENVSSPSIVMELIQTQGAAIQL